MATLEAATVELQKLNGTSEIQLEAMFEQNDAINAFSVSMDQTNIILVDILAVMKDFIKAVPEEISKGYDALLSFQEKEALLKRREDAAKAKKKKNPKDKPTVLPSDEDGFFKSNFKKGMEKDLGAVSKMKEILAEAIIVAGGVATLFGKVFKGVIFSLRMFKGIAVELGKVLLASIKGLGTALKVALRVLTAPFTLLTIALIGLALGVKGLIEGWQGEEGTLADKYLAALGGFIKGFLKVVTVPLDLLKDGISWVAGALGFEKFEEFLDGFSFTEGAGEIVDAIFGFAKWIKNWIADKVKGLFDGIKGFFGFGDDEVETLSGSERKVLEDVRDAREDGVKRMVAQGFTQEEAEARADKGSFDPIKTRKESRKLSTKQINDRLNEDMSAQVIAQAKTPEGASSVKEKQYRYDVTDPVTGELIDSAGTPEEAAKIAMKTGGKMENAVERTSTDAATQQKLADRVAPPSNKRGKTIGDSPAAPAKVKANGKRGMSIDTPTQPKKVKLPEGVKQSPVSGLYGARNQPSKIYAEFKTPEEAGKWLNASFEEAAKINPSANEKYQAKLAIDAEMDANFAEMMAEEDAPAVSAPVVKSLKRGLTIGDSSAAPAEVGANGKRGMVIGGSERVGATEAMKVEQNKLDENRASATSGGSNMVVAPTNNTSVVNNQTVNAGPMPSAMDRSDRTDGRRGRKI
jgi:hypothetical protein